jgi:hydroxyacylglutathione hydrolase
MTLRPLRGALVRRNADSPTRQVRQLDEVSFLTATGIPAIGRYQAVSGTSYAETTWVKMASRVRERPEEWQPCGLYNLHKVLQGPSDLASASFEGDQPVTAPLEIHTIVSQPFAENTYVVWRKGRTDALVIDPGLEPELILDFLHEGGLTPASILNTHGHADHIGGNEALKAAYPEVPLIIGVNDARLLTDADANLSAPFGLPIVSPTADRLVREGDIIEAGGIRLEVLDIPGHSPGHVVFLYREEPIVVFGGDVLFREGIGRYDFPGSNGPLLFKGIQTKLFTLPPDTVIYPGHGPHTTVGHEQRANPFVGEA